MRTDVYYLPSEGNQLNDDAEWDAFAIVRSTYPIYLRTRKEIEQLAAQRVESWMHDPSKRLERDTIVSKSPTTLPKLTNDPSLFKLIFINGFVKGYIKEVERKDGKIDEAVAPVAAPTSQIGVTVTVVKVERKQDLVVYTIVINDPGQQYPFLRQISFDLTKLKPFNSEGKTYF